MSRTTAVNFAGGLQFPLANAATDLFKKEDVQTLALAVDGHDHSAGKGLILPASSIPDGSITSAKIADGAIATADIAVGAVTSLLGNYQAGTTFSSTTTGTWLATPVGFSSTYDGASLVYVCCTVTVSHSVSGAQILVGIARDGTVLGGIGAGVYQSAAANQPQTISVHVVDSAAPSGSRSWGLYLMNQNAGTASIIAGVYSTLQAWEWRR